jgi:hypothetical protein
MRKTLIPALLVVSAAFAPCLPSVVAFLDRASIVARTIASPLVWHLWDELLSCELTQWIQPAPHDGPESECLAPELRTAL